MECPSNRGHLIDAEEKEKNWGKNGPDGFVHRFGSIKHYRWSHYARGSLVFVKNRTTWTVKVPDELRDDVDRLLESQGVRRFDGGGEAVRQ